MIAYLIGNFVRIPNMAIGFHKNQYFGQKWRHNDVSYADFYKKRHKITIFMTIYHHNSSLYRFYPWVLMIYQVYNALECQLFKIMTIMMSFDVNFTTIFCVFYWNCIKLPFLTPWNTTIAVYIGFTHGFLFLKF